MNVADVINGLWIVVLIGFVVALILLIALLYRANRVVSRVDDLSGTFKSFVSDIVPAIVNVGTIATAMHGILRALSEHHKDSKHTSKK